MLFFFFFKQKTAYEIKECDWSSDVCSSDLTVIRYPGGKVIKNIETFNATNPAHVRAVISGSTVEEIVIEEIELRN